MTKRSFNTRKKEHINYIKHFHPEKSAFAKHTLELDHRTNWSKTQIIAFENDFRKRCFIHHFLLIPPPTSRHQVFFDFQFLATQSQRQYYISKHCTPFCSSDVLLIVQPFRVLNQLIPISCWENLNSLQSKALFSTM